MAKKVTKHSRMAFLLTGLLTSSLVLSGLTMSRTTELQSGASSRIPTVTQTTETYQFKSGDNAFSVPGKSSLTAKVLCETVPSVRRVSRYNQDTDQYETYNCDPQAGLAFNFVIEAHRGYQMKLVQPAQYTITYEQTVQDISTINDEILTGLHHRDSSETVYAQDICDDFTATGHPFKYINRTGAHPPVYRCNSGAQINNFQIESQKAYFLDEFLTQ